MTILALFAGDTAVRIFAADEAAEAAEHPADTVADVSAVPGFAVGWQRRPDGTFGPFAPTVPALIAYTNARQWALAVGGFTATIRGEPVIFATDATALGLMDGKVMRLAQPNPPASVNWQVGPTSFVTIAADDFVHAATKASDFVQATFDALPAVFAGIADGTITTAAQVDAASWPVASAVVS